VWGLTDEEHVVLAAVGEVVYCGARDRFAVARLEDFPVERLERLKIKIDVNKTCEGLKKKRTRQVRMPHQRLTR